jgi:FAD/FMN-containing dehydrogenase
VTASGEVLSRLSGLVKDNTGYDLSHLLVGSEGTLAIVTAARLRLVPHLPERAVLLVGLDSTAAALELVSALRTSLPSMTAAEIFYRDGVELVCAQTGLTPPWAPPSEAYLLVECAARHSPLDELTEALADQDLADRTTAVATDPSGIERLWAYRERHTEAVSSIGIPHKLDVTLPLGRLGEFEPAVRRRIQEVAPDSTTILWGHVGDGNLHVNIVGPEPEDEKVDLAVLETVAAMGGSISAEHGIGRAKTAWLGLSRSPAEISSMRAVKAALDPSGLLNPGVLLP